MSCKIIVGIKNPDLNKSGLQIRTNGVVREVLQGIPPLLEDEKILYKARIGKTITIIVGIILCFVPPFIFGPVLIIIEVYYFQKNRGLWVSEQRIIYFYKRLFGGGYFIQSIPLSRIKTIRKRPSQTIDLLNHHFRIGDVQVFTHDTMWIKIQFESIKYPGKLIDFVKTIVKEM